MHLFVSRPYTCDNGVLLLWRPAEPPQAKERVLRLLQAGGRQLLPQCRASERHSKVGLNFVTKLVVYCVMVKKSRHQYSLSRTCVGEE